MLCLLWRFSFLFFFFASFVKDLLYFRIWFRSIIYFKLNFLMIQSFIFMRAKHSFFIWSSFRLLFFYSSCLKVRLNHLRLLKRTKISIRFNLICYLISKGLVFLSNNCFIFEFPFCNIVIGELSVIKIFFWFIFMQLQYFHFLEFFPNIT